MSLEILIFRGIELLVIVLVLVMSVSLHELAHAWSAMKLGDDTAERAGRLTLNPMAHLDWFGSLFMPILTFVMGGFIFGYANPVPVDESRLRQCKIGPFRLDGGLCVSLAGVIANFLTALLFGLAYRFLLWGGIASLIGLQPAVLIMSVILMTVSTNLILAFFNLLPIPPLDGWRIWGAFLSPQSRAAIEYNAGLFLLLFFVMIFLLPQLFLGPVFWLVRFFFVLFSGGGF